MLDWTKNLLPKSATEAHRRMRSIGLIKTFSLLAFIITILASLPDLAHLPDSTPSLLNRAILCLIYLVTYLLAYRGKTWLASLFLTSVLWLANTVLTFFLGGFNALGLSGYIVVIILASLLFDNRAGMAYFALTLLTILVLLIAELNGVHLPALMPQSRTMLWVGQGMMFIVIILLLQLAFRTLQDAIGRASQNERELERRAVQIQVASEVARDATAVRQVDKLLDRAVELISERFGYYHAAIFLIDEAGEYAMLKAATSPARQTLLESGHHLKVGEAGIVGYVAGCGQPRVAPDVGQDAMHIKNPLLSQTRSEVALPINVNQKVVGVLDVQSQQEAAFDDQNVAILQTLADQLAVAFETAHLFEAAQRQLRELSVLHAVAIASSRFASEDELIEAATQIIGNAFYPDNFGVILLDEKTNLLYEHPSYREFEGDQAEKLPLGQGVGISGTVAITGQPMRVEDVSKEKTYYLIDPRTRSELCVPLKVGERVIGVINAESTHLNAFSEADERLLATLSGQLATGIQRARLYEESQHQLRELALLLEASAAVSNSLEMNTVLTITAQQITKALGVEGCLIAIWDPTEDILTSLLSYSCAPPWKPDPEGTIYRLSEYPATKRVITDRKPLAVHASDPQADAAEKRWMQSNQCKSQLIVPLVARDQVLGTLTILSVAQEFPFTDEEIGLCQTMVNHMATAVENARLYDQAQQHARELTDALARLQELDRLKSEFVQNVSHELRTPLAIVLGYAEMFASGELGELRAEQTEPMAIIVRRMRSLSKLLDDLLTLVETEAHSRAHQPVDLAEMAYVILTEFQVQAVQAGLQLEVEIAPDLPPVWGIYSHLQRVLDNLVSNALKFTPVGGRVTICLRPEDEKVMLEVIDTGIGISDSQRERIFERFYQVDGSTTRRYGGVGLGLALVKEVVEAHGGSVSVKRNAGTGTTFQVALPAKSG